jgi:peptidoglycan/LPS O-acetylase OafA/YrhL
VVCAVVINAVYNLAWLRDHTGQVFDDWIVAAICLLSILIIVWTTRIRHLPLSSGIVIAIGGMTYPLYLLHQQIGYDIFSQVGPVRHPAVLVAMIVLAIALLSWATWRFVENPAQRFTKQALTGFALRFTK